MSIEILRKILEIGNLNIAFYSAFIIFVLTNQFRFLLSFLSCVAITGFLKMIMQPFNPSGHAAMATIILIWVSFLSNNVLTFLLSGVILALFSYSLIVTNGHTTLETIAGIFIATVCFYFFTYIFK